jgi:N4-(beta-N-acetylglucosaminyl)-L-asparaginase
MKSQINRRRFVAVAGVGALGGRALFSAAGAPQVLTRKGSRPVVIAAANGNVSKDPEGLTCVAKAFKLVTGGADVLDAAVAGVNIVELDPEDTSVGYGGLPNADGVVQLDASVMHGPRKQAGAVACLEGVRTPSLVAKKVMEETDHHLLVGQGAQQFARNMGFQIEADLNTEKSRRLWLEWKRRTDPEHYPEPKKRAEAWRRAGLAMVAEGLIDPEHFYGTINCNVVNAAGEIAGTTTTSGLAWKIPGRVGDSPILGAGLYVDGAWGAAGSTGRGEANLFSLGSFVVVEAMRNGMSPKDAGLAALKRLVANTIEKRLLNSQGRPNFNVVYYAVNVQGDYAATSLYASSGKKPVSYAVCTDDHPRTEQAEAMFEGSPEEEG